MDNDPVTTVSPLMAAIRDKLRAVLDEQPFGLRQLTQITEISARAHPLAQVTEANEQGIDLAQLKRKSNSVGIYTNSVGPIDTSQINFGMDEGSYPETFGAKALRELLPLLTGKKEPSLVSLIEAIASARAEGLDDVVMHLKAQLKKRLGKDAGVLELDEAEVTLHAAAVGYSLGTAPAAAPSAELRGAEPGWGLGTSLVAAPAVPPVPVELAAGPVSPIQPEPQLKGDVR